MNIGVMTKLIRYDVKGPGNVYVLKLKTLGKKNIKTITTVEALTQAYKWVSDKNREHTTT
jgi:hypothetical protein